MTVFQLIQQLSSMNPALRVVLSEEGLTDGPEYMYFADGELWAAEDGDAETMELVVVL